MYTYDDMENEGPVKIYNADKAVYINTVFREGIRSVGLDVELDKIPIPFTYIRNWCPNNFVPKNKPDGVSMCWDRIPHGYIPCTPENCPLIRELTEDEL